MTERAIYITEFDRQRLSELIADLHRTGYPRREALRDLEGELARAVIVSPQDVPPAVVTRTLPKPKRGRSLTSRSARPLWMYSPRVAS